MGEHTITFINLVKDFGRDADELRSLVSSQRLPLFSLWNEFGEAMAFFESNDDKFSDQEAAVIHQLDNFITNLPPEPDSHWTDDSLENPLWQETRMKVRHAIAELQEANKPH